jgi:phage terminase large subunit
MASVQLLDQGNDFLKQEIKPTEKQEQLCQIPDEIFEVLYGGAAYGGKTFILTLLPLIKGWYKNHGFKGIILRRKFTDLERENIRLSKEYYPKTGAKYNESKHVWYWPEYSSYVDFGHIQHAADVKQYDSAQYNYAFYDELTHFEESSYLYLVGSRVRPSSSFNLAVARSGSNPGGIGQTFVYNRFVKPNEKGGVLIKDTRTGLTRMYIRALLQDNPHGLEYDPDYANKLELLPEAEKRAKKYGDWHAFKGSVFTTFRPIRFPGEPDNALHVIEPFQIPEWWPRIMSIDWGKRAMCHAMWAAISPDKRVYIYRERSWKGRDIPFWAGEIREINDECNEHIVHTTLCGSAWQERGTETIADQFQQYSGLVPSSSENTPGSRVAGLQTVHDFFRWEQKIALRSKEAFYDIEKANYIYRMNGPEALIAYKSQFFDEALEQNLPILQVFNTCQILIETIPMAIYDEKKIEDIAEFDGDDPLDNLRYLCKTARRFIMGELGIDMETAIKRQAVINELKESQDMTKFYRQMENIERGNNLVGVGHQQARMRPRLLRRRMN